MSEQDTETTIDAESTTEVEPTADADRVPIPPGPVCYPSVTPT